MNTNQKEVKSKLYLEIITFIFAISMVAGYEQILIGTFDNINKLNVSNFVFLWKTIYVYFPLLMCSLVLLRFFFAPVCNVKALLENSSIQKSERALSPCLIMLFDIPILLSHSIVFFFMCRSASINIALSNKQFYYFFMFLLFLNGVWLTTIQLRIKNVRNEKFFVWDRENQPFLFWTSNNLIILILLISSLRLSWGIEVRLVFINCILDLSLTANAYFRASYLVR